MNNIKELFKKYREIIMYIIIGVCTTLVNLITYTIMYKYLNIDINVSNVVSIISAIIFAYFTNRIFVFESKNNTIQEITAEIIKFISARIVTMIIEVVGVYVLVVMNHNDEFIGKLKVQVIVLVLNYIMSKFIVFKKSKGESDIITDNH